MLRTITIIVMKTPYRQDILHFDIVDGGQDDGWTQKGIITMRLSFLLRIIIIHDDRTER